MHISEQIVENVKIVTVKGEGHEKVITDTQSALDLLITVRYTYQADRIALEKEAVADDFFILSTGLAGEILQKYKNYGGKLAVFGDYSHYTSKPLHDFIRESNQGRDFFFLSNEEDAVRALALARSAAF